MEESKPRSLSFSLQAKRHLRTLPPKLLPHGPGLLALTRCMAFYHFSLSCALCRPHHGDETRTPMRRLAHTPECGSLSAVSLWTDLPLGLQGTLGTVRLSFSPPPPNASAPSPSPVRFRSSGPSLPWPCPSAQPGCVALVTRLDVSVCSILPLSTKLLPTALSKAGIWLRRSPIRELLLAPHCRQNSDLTLQVLSQSCHH